MGPPTFYCASKWVAHLPALPLCLESPVSAVDAADKTLDGAIEPSVSQNVGGPICSPSSSAAPAS